MKTLFLSVVLLGLCACSSIAPQPSGDTVRSLWRTQAQDARSQRDHLDAAAARAVAENYHKAMRQGDSHAAAQAMVVGLSK